MSKKYEQLAQDVIKKVGGKENVISVYHCATRLRFKLVDENNADKEALLAQEGVSTVISNSGSYQVVIGPHVADVFEEIEKLVDVKTEKDDSQKEKFSASSLFDFISGVFMPIIPALSGAGMVKAVLAILVVANVISTDSQTYFLLNNIFADGVFYFLPMMLAYTTAQKMKCNPILAVAVAAMMMHPNWSTLVATGESVNFFDVIPFTLVGYGSSVIPIILIIVVQSFVEKFLHKIIPAAIELVFLPLITFLVMGTLAFSILGPFGYILGQYLADFFMWLSTNASWAPPLLIGLTCPLMIMIGLHNAVAPLGVVQMTNLGYDGIWGPGNICSNMAVATAAAVVALRAKDKTSRQLATSSSITAYVGITEPALYGVVLPKKYPLIAAMIGGACGGLFAGLTGTHRFATGSASIFAAPLYIGDNTMVYFYNIIIAIVISVVITAILTFVLSFKYEKKETESSSDELSIDEGTILTPVKGEVMSLDKAEDEAFATGAMGDGVVILPSEGKVVAPFSGTISVLFPTKHAIGLTSDSGVEVLIHIGMNTVEMNGEGFDAKVKQGDYVEVGQTLVEFDIDKIKNAGFSTQTMVIVTNTADYESVSANFADASKPLLVLSR
ncbi:beta-glucoside-specific PTS transporter subunit IIABC [Breznakia pachnodae]|uniref:PTS system beta-glucosides-specific IIC component n=1 Tax=Breznakia pachnodae TaxID=265178 RepID=A0ABU0E0K5_9FIRM|nr:beta-glucoside-specific PTS transporter subunit IIABC [Breznakia pachnodae]MDQ0360421.1 PTS system beta-glucosides-specific IIC component [Breznakia pachnodae]